jgi:hypothetical protein
MQTLPDDDEPAGVVVVGVEIPVREVEVVVVGLEVERIALPFIYFPPSGCTGEIVPTF